MNNRELGEKILDGLGGPENISHMTHCATRLRVTPVSNEAVQNEKIKSLPGVLTVIEQSGQTQVVLGDRVEAVYNEINALPSMSKQAESEAPAESNGKKAGWLTNVFDVLSDSFRPLLWALLGTSMILTLIVFLQQLGFFGQYTDLTGQVVNVDIVNGARVADKEAATALNNQWMHQFAFWYILKAASLSVLNFMPIMLGATAAKRLGANMWVGAAIPAALMTGTFTDLTALADPATKVLNVPFFGLDLPLYAFSYTGQVFPPLLAVALLAPLERFLKKVIPSMLQMVFVPMISVMILVPLTVFLVGPIGIGVAMGISDFLKMINDVAPGVVGALIAGLYLFMVPLGLHWPLNALQLANIASTGSAFIQGPMGAWNFACFGATAGVLFLSIRDRDTDMRQTASGALAAGLFGGISEPSLYGIHLRFKRIYPLMLTGCVVGGLVIGIGRGVITHTFVFTSLLTIPVFSPMAVYGLGIAAAFFTAFLMVVFFDYRTKEQKVEARAKKSLLEDDAPAPAAAPAAAPTAAPAAEAAPEFSDEAKADLTLTSPMAGTTVALSDVADEAFAAGALGPGIAVSPAAGAVVVAPCDGKVSVAFPTGHAYGIKSASGVQVLIHIGMDTVKLEGKGFTPRVAKGDVVKRGDVLAEVDWDVIREAGYDTITPMVVTNKKKFGEITPAAPGPVGITDAVVTVSPKEA